MDCNFLDVRIKGKNTKVPYCRIDGWPVIVLGKWIRIARVHEEEWTHGEAVKDPVTFTRQMKQRGLSADVFTFTQKIPETAPKHRLHYDWDNLAAIRIRSFREWWESLPQESRKNTRRSAKRGVSVRVAQLDDGLIQGITDIYNETPIRQGKRFPHFGKGFNTIKGEVSTLMDRSEFIGAFYGDELVGFIKLVCMGNIASILHIVSKNAHYDKRPTNALITKAVELCSEKGISYLVYGNYTYGNKSSSALMEFKKRNGFEKVLLPRYYVPLSAWGRLVVKLRLYRGLLGLMPSVVVNTLVDFRAIYFERLAAKTFSLSKPENSEPARNLAENVG